MTTGDDITRLFRDRHIPVPLGRRLIRWKLLFLRWLYAVRIERHEREVEFYRRERREVLHKLAREDE